MARPKRWTSTEITNGVGTIRLHSWKYFLDYVYQEMLDYENYIWRGQRCDDWKLESTLDRLIHRAKVPSTKRNDFRSAHLERFKFAVRGRRGSNPPRLAAENDWWALGQHHGLATPLLDWTGSPFVAAYFAFISRRPPQTTRRAVYALFRPRVAARSLELKVEQAKLQEERVSQLRKANPVMASLVQATSIREPVEFIRPLSDENARLVNQAGLFTRAPDGVPLDRWVPDNFGDRDGYVLLKITIPNTDRELCLRSLNRMNINQLTLFPDLYGASTFCNHSSEIKKY